MVLSHSPKPARGGSVVRPDPTRQRDEADEREDEPRADDDHGGERDDSATTGGLREETDPVGTDEEDGRGDGESQSDENPPNRVAIGHEEWSAEAEI